LRWGLQIARSVSGALREQVRLRGAGATSFVGHGKKACGHEIHILDHTATAPLAPVRKEKNSSAIVRRSFG
jgi:hypothetical protein